MLARSLTENQNKKNQFYGHVDRKDYFAVFTALGFRSVMWCVTLITVHAKDMVSRQTHSRN